MNFVTTFDIELLASKLCKQLVEAEEVWLTNCMRIHFPGIYSLVVSRQPRAALLAMKALGIHVAVWPDGRKELRCNKRRIATLVTEVIWDGLKIQNVYHYGYN